MQCYLSTATLGPILLYLSSVKLPGSVCNFIQTDFIYLDVKLYRDLILVCAFRYTDALPSVMGNNALSDMGGKGVGL